MVHFASKKLIDSILCFWLIRSDTRNTKLRNMRTKTLLLSAAVGVAGLVAASAQTVYSVNSVGYVNVDLVTGFNMIGNPLDAGTDDLNDILPTVPDGSIMFFFRNGGWTETAEYFAGVGWFADPLPTWPAGEAVVVQVPSAATVTFVGEVRQGDLSTPLSAGLSLVSSQVPQAATLDDLGLPGTEGDVVFTWDAVAQAYGDSAEYFGGVGWFSSNPITVGVAEGFVLSAQNAGSWDRSFSVNN